MTWIEWLGSYCFRSVYLDLLTPTGAWCFTNTSFVLLNTSVKLYGQRIHFCRMNKITIFDTNWTSLFVEPNVMSMGKLLAKTKNWLMSCRHREKLLTLCYRDTVTIITSLFVFILNSVKQTLLSKEWSYQSCGI